MSPANAQSKKKTPPHITKLSAPIVHETTSQTAPTAGSTWTGCNSQNRPVQEAKRVLQMPGYFHTIVEHLNTIKG
jgi:hypothetical protein